jgi:hypothetical protein
VLLPRQLRSRSSRRAVALAAVLCVLLALSAAMTGGAALASLLCLAPALLIPALLALGWFPGERLLATFARRARKRRRAPRARRPRLVPAGLPRGGRLLAASLAGRAPPPLAQPS